VTISDIPILEKMLERASKFLEG